MIIRSSPRLRAIVASALFLIILIVTWLFRFNDPGGAYAGLTDDHFFYLVRGWQILFGDLPVRDFVDHGAPLDYYAASAVQRWLGRGTLSELIWCTTALSLAAAITFWLAARASGSLACALVATLVHVLLEPRFYNYPKILVYAIAIPVIWWFAARPGPQARFWAAAITVVAFLFRHDHGVFVAISFIAVVVLLPDLPRPQRWRHVAWYGGLVFALLSPYLAFIQWNGGLPRYFREAAAWAARDRARAPIAWPGVFDVAASGGILDIVRANFVAWMYYIELCLPLLALAILWASRDALRPEWPRARVKIAAVAVLAITLNAGFLRSPLEARLADPSVPHAILIAWLLATIPAAIATRKPARIAISLAVLPLMFVVIAGLSGTLQERLHKTGLVNPFEPLDRADEVRRQLEEEWDLSTWVQREDRPELVTLSLYLYACTAPDDRIFVQPYVPQVLGLARRAFAGGHADLRPGFFTSTEAQQLTLARLQRQSVPVLLLETGDEYANFRKSFPMLVGYFDEHYELAATRVFDRRFGIQLFVSRNRAARGRFDLLDWPCFQ